MILLNYFERLRKSLLFSMCTCCCYFFRHIHILFFYYTDRAHRRHASNRTLFRDRFYLSRLIKDRLELPDYGNICFIMTHSQDVDSIIQFCINIVNYGYTAICIFFFLFSLLQMYRFVDTISARFVVCVHFMYIPRTLIF